MIKQKGFAPIITVVLIAIVVVAGAYIAKNKGLFDNLHKISILLPSPTPVLTPDPTTDWKTYINTKYGFSFKYPSELILTDNCTEYAMGTHMICLKSKDFSFLMSEPDKNNLESTKTTLTSTSGFGLFFDQIESNSLRGIDSLQEDYKKTFDNVTSVTTYKTPMLKIVTNKFPDEVIWIIPHDKNIFRITSPFNTDKYPIINQILSTFKFTDNFPTPTPNATINKVKILDTSSWIEYSCNLISYKLPSNYTQQCHVGTDGIYDEIIYREKEGYSGSSIFVKQYNGGSRRQYWIDTVKASDSEVSKYVIFQESLFGTISGLDVFASGGWWQGGYASPILISHDKTIVSIHGGRDYNEVTKKITRWDISDTIASTIKFNK